MPNGTYVEWWALGVKDHWGGCVLKFTFSIGSMR